MPSITSLCLYIYIGVEDDLKAKLPREKAGSLHYCGIDIVSFRSFKLHTWYYGNYL